MSRWLRAETVLVVALLLAGGAAWGLHARKQLVARPESLEGISRELAGLLAADIPVGDETAQLLMADYHLQRAYEHDLGGLVWLYVGYYGTARGGTPEHTPRTCYGAQGWQVEEQTVLPFGVGGGLRTNEYVVANAGQRRLVHFYYRSFRSSGVLSLLRLRWDHFLGNLQDGRADGALVRLSAPIAAGDHLAARSRLLGFAAGLEAELAEHWPEERSRD